MNNPRILIVDDEPNIRASLARWFRLSGFDVDVAEDGDLAVEKCATMKYDVITMDIEMPRVNGVQAILAIRQCQPDASIIVLTGYARDSDEASQCGATRILSKPIRLRELEAAVRSVIARPPCPGP